MSAESTAAFERYFLHTAQYEGLRELATPDGYLKVDAALAKWSRSSDPANFYEWCRDDMDNVKDIVCALFGISLIDGNVLIWPRSGAEAIKAWGPGGDGPWENGTFEMCWKALLDNATLLDNKTPLFKCDDTPEGGGEWVRAPIICNTRTLL